MTSKPSSLTGAITTHVLDTANGLPAADIVVEMFRLHAGGRRESLALSVTNEDGRCPEPLLAGKQIVRGVYEIVFRTGDYIRMRDAVNVDPLFLDEVPVRFGVSDVSAHYHIPLLLSPFGYSTYRGS